MRFRPENRFEILIGVLLVVGGVFTRLLPHPANFTPMTAIALFGGAVLPAPAALTLPLIVMIASDLWIGPHPLFWLTWGSFFVVSLLGLAVGRRPKTGLIFSAAAGGSLFFFITTNLGVFLFQDLYPKTPSGLVQCYAMALPFFKNSLLADLFYTAALFGTFAAVKRTAKILPS